MILHGMLVLTMLNRFEIDKMWESLNNSSTHFKDDKLSIECLDDDFQLLFLQIVLKHFDDILNAQSRKE